MAEDLYVQYGCGFCAPDGWRNFDASPTLRFERLPFLGRLSRKNSQKFPQNVEPGDIVNGLPLAPGSCRAVYCSHVLEHLSLESFRVALVNTRTILRPGGTFRFVVPDLEFLAKEYLSDSGEDAASAFMRNSCLGYEKRPKGIRGFIVEWLGNSRHLWMWDFKSIQPELERAGFTEIRRAQFGDSPDQKFKDVESEGRWHNCLGIEAKRP